MPEVDAFSPLHNIEDEPPAGGLARDVKQGKDATGGPVTDPEGGGGTVVRVVPLLVRSEP